MLNSYSDDVYAVIAARFGLAAIAENRGDWDAAAKQYDELLKITKDFPSYQQMATQRRDRL